MVVNQPTKVGRFIILLDITTRMFAHDTRTVSKAHKVEKDFHIIVLTLTGDLLVLFVTAVVVELSVRVVKHRPALRMLHGISVTLIMHLATPKSQKYINEFNTIYIFPVTNAACFKSRE